MGNHTPHGHKGKEPGDGKWAAILIFLFVAIPLIWYVLSHVGLLR